MAKYLFTVVLFFSLTANAQTNTSWQHAADNLLSTIPGSDDFDSYMQQEEFLETLSKVYSDKQDIRLAYLLAVLGPFDQSEVYFQQVTAAFEKQPYPHALFLLDYNRMQGTHGTRGVDQISKALSLLRTLKLDSTIIYAHALKDYGEALNVEKHYEEANQQLNKAILLAEHIDGHGQLYSDLLHSLSNYYESIGNTEKSVEYNELDNRNTASELGINQPYNILFTKAEFDFTSLTSDQQRVAMLLQYTQPQSIYRQAMAAWTYEEALKTTINDPLLKTQLYYHKGLAEEAFTLLAIEDLQTAVRQFRQAYQTKRSVNLATHLYNSINQLGCAYFRARHYDKARDVFKELEELFSNSTLSTGPWQEAIAHNLILCNAKLKDYAQLGTRLQRYTGDHATWFTTNSKAQMTKYGDLLFQLGEYSAAQRVYTRAYNQYWGELEDEFLNHPSEPFLDADGNELEMIDQQNILLDIGPTQVVYEIHKYKPTGDAYVQLLYKLAQTTFLTHAYAEAREYCLTYINEFYTEIDHSHENLQRGTDLYEIYRLKERLFPAYDLFQNIVMKDTAAAADVKVDSRMRAYAQLLDSKANIQYEYRHMRNTIETGNDEALKQAYRTYKERREQLAKQKLSDGDPTAYENLKISIDTLRTYLSQRTALVSNPSRQFVFWDTIQHSLRQGEAAIEIKRFQTYDSGRWTAKVTYAAFIITPNSIAPEVVYLTNGNYLETRGVKQYQNAIAFKMEDPLSYSSFWKPIQAKLTGVKKIYLAPDGVYNQINLNTLFNPVTKKYLANEVKLVNLISTKDLRVATDGGHLKIRKATLMGRPLYYINGSGHTKPNPFEDPKRALTRKQLTEGVISDLPGTEAEVTSIDAILKKKGVQTQYYLGKASTEKAFKQSPASIIHVATHGFWFAESNTLSREDAMFNSGLLFAGVKDYYEGGNDSQDEDGILTAYEVQGMNLEDTQLVVLSACETGLGQVEVGEGVYGLQRAFSIAGADKMIMSLWKVDDEATQQLFTSFYSYWVGGKYEITEAFYRAQAELQTKYDHPYYWGAFVLVD